MTNHSMTKITFIGEKPSITAFEKGWTWKSGRLAAKTLFDALHAMDIDPQACEFLNLFGDHPDDPECPGTGRLSTISAIAEQNIVIAMGLKVARELQAANIPHRVMRHPAARGAGRRRDLYLAHVRETLA